MYQAGDLIFYGRTGVCRVERIERNGEQQYYCLQPLYQKCAIRTPVAGKVFMRPIMSAGDADALIDHIPSLRPEPVECRAVRELSERYLQMIQSHSPEDLVLLTMSIHRKRQNLLRDRRKLGAIDERFMREGESLLFGELAAALSLPVGEIPEYIRSRLGDRVPEEMAQAIE